MKNIFIIIFLFCTILQLNGCLTSDEMARLTEIEQKISLAEKRAALAEERIATAKQEIQSIEAVRIKARYESRYKESPKQNMIDLF